VKHAVAICANQSDVAQLCFDLALKGAHWNRVVGFYEVRESPDGLLQRDHAFQLNERLAKGPIKFKITVQVAEDGDIVNDATVHWPAERKVVELGTIALTSTVAKNAQEQKHIIFDPIPRLDGIEPSDDPLLELRAAVYLISGRRRRTAPEQ
jgi:catalase